jgi:hypothetical protein
VVEEREVYRVQGKQRAVAAVMVLQGTSRRRVEMGAIALLGLPLLPPSASVEALHSGEGLLLSMYSPLVLADMQD